MDEVVDTFSLGVTVQLRSIKDERERTAICFGLADELRDQLREAVPDVEFDGDGMGDGVFDIFAYAPTVQVLQRAAEVAATSVKWPAGTVINGHDLATGELLLHFELGTKAAEGWWQRRRRR